MKNESAFNKFRYSAKLNKLTVKKCYFNYNLIKFERNVQLLRSSFQGHVEIGLNSYINPKSDIRHCTIGRYCSIANEVIISPDRHPTSWLSTHPAVAMGSKQPYNDYVDRMVNIGHDVWIGGRSTIMAGVTIGHGAVVGGGAIVTRDVPPYAIVVGSPAKIHRYRFGDALIENLLDLCWWQYDILSLSRSVDFSNTESSVEILKEKIGAGIINKIQSHFISEYILGEARIDFK